MRKSLILGFTILILSISCSNQEKCAAPETGDQKPLNPNGDSELALMMRAMFDEADSIRQLLADGESIDFFLDHQKILTAEATTPEDVATPEYEALANAYLYAVDELKYAAPEDRLSIYDNMIDNCMNCHTAICPGPKVRIKKLYLD